VLVGILWGVFLQFISVYINAVRTLHVARRTIKELL
jgi:hypothetical protein